MNKLFTPIRDLDTFRSLIRFQETTENQFWDFKAKLNMSTPDDTAIDLCAFANTFGGTLIVGISEKTLPDGRRVACDISPGIKSDEVKRHMQTSVLKAIEPSISTVECILSVDSKTVYCLNVRPSPNLLGVRVKSDRRSFCFPYRTTYGNQYFQFKEIEERMMASQSRAVYLRILEILKGRESIEVKIYPKPYVAEIKTSRLRMISDNPFEFDLSINSRLIRLPYSMIREIWNKTNAGEDICLLLNEQIWEDGNQGELDIGKFHTVADSLCRNGMSHQ